jgi:transcriptional regulator GlxA family with amidase domain
MISDAVLANLDALAGGIIHSILQRIDQIEQRSDATRHLHPGLAGALVFIEHEFARPFRLADVARHAGLSPSHLSALFRAAFKCSPMAYSMGIRMRLAKALLDDPHLSVKEVGVRCGFRDTNYFCRAFRRFHGQSPGVCRRA